MPGNAVNPAAAARVSCSCDTGLSRRRNPEKEIHHDQNYRYSDRRPVRNRSIRSSACGIGLRNGFGPGGIGSSFGASSQRTGSQENASQESKSGQRIGFGIGSSVDPCRSGSGSQQVIAVHHSG
jgi:hypothetical protein